MVGAGIYLKNSDISGGVLDVAQGNPILAISMWIIIGLICTMMMLVFIEGFSSFKKNEHSSLQALSIKFINRKFASFLSFYITVIFLPIMIAIGGLFTVQTLFDGIDAFLKLNNHTNSINNLISIPTQRIIEIVFGLGLLIIFSLMNALTKKPGKNIQNVLTILKILPILIVIFGGIIMFSIGMIDENVFDKWNSQKSGQTIGAIAILGTATPVMYGFIGFIDGAAIQKDIKHKSVIAPGLLFGMLFTVTFYILITIVACLSTSNGNMFELLNTMFQSHPWLMLLTRIVIAITVLSQLNGYTMISGNSLKSCVEEKLIYVKKYHLKGISEKHASLIQFSIVFTLQIIFIAISLMINSDATKESFLDYFFVTNLLSDVISICSFTLYLVLTISILKNRKTNFVETKKQKGVLTIGIIAASMLTILVIYLYLDMYIFKFIGPIDPKELSKRIIVPTLFTTLLALIVSLYLLNQRKLKKSQAKETIMKIGIPKEIKAQENRVSLTPNGVIELVKQGHGVLVESGAGVGSGFSDAEYEKSGANISKNVADVWKQEMVIKVKEPLPEEFKYFYENQIIFTYFHLAGLKDLTEELMKKKVIAIAYETVQTQDRLLPLLRPMSEVAGRMSVMMAANLLFKTNNGVGILASGTPGTPKAKFTIIGGGIAGTNAAKMAVGLEANVTIIEWSENRIRELHHIFGDKVSVMKSNYENIAKSVKNSDVVISTVLIPGKKAPKLVTTEMVKSMKENSVIIDVAIDQGASVETIDRSTTHEKPTFIKHGVIHYSVANMPGAVPRTSTIALTNATIDYIMEIASKGWLKAVKTNHAIKLGLQTLEGKLVYENVAVSLDLPYTNVDSIINQEN